MLKLYLKVFYFNYFIVFFLIFLLFFRLVSVLLMCASVCVGTQVPIEARRQRQMLRAKPLSSERAASPLDPEPSLQSLNYSFRYPSPIMDKSSSTLITRSIYISKQTQGKVTFF